MYCFRTNLLNLSESEISNLPAYDIQPEHQFAKHSVRPGRLGVQANDYCLDRIDNNRLNTKGGGLIALNLASDGSREPHRSNSVIVHLVLFVQAECHLQA